MIINEQIYKDKVLACWIGKNIGGTVGFPMEFCRQINIIDGYGKAFDHPMPNDDLDLQLLWLIAMEEKGFPDVSERLAEYWQRYVTPHWAEYGIAKVNMKSGILPPLSGTVHNDMFKNSNGAWIRSEIWACLTPGKPDYSASSAILDAIIDHGDGEGSWAEIFCAALQSCAFIESDLYKIIAVALSYIPEDCGIAQAVTSAIHCYQTGMSLAEARNYLLTHHRGKAAGGKQISEEDLKAGFADGKCGYDAPLNVAIVIAGMLYGEGNFDKMIRSTIYFGEDTDCTVGTAASTYGLLYGTEIIEEKWKKPIGNRIVTACLNLGEMGVYGDILPQTVEEFTDRLYHLHLQYGFQKPIYVADKAGFDTENIDIESLRATPATIKYLKRSMTHVAFHFDFYNIYINYGGDCSLPQKQPKKITVTIQSSYKTPDIINLRWLVPDEVTVTPTQDGQVFLMLGGFEHSEQTLEFTFTAEQVNSINRFALELTIDGRTTCMYVPIVFYNGNYNQNQEENI